MSITKTREVFSLPNVHYAAISNENTSIYLAKAKGFRGMAHTPIPNLQAKKGCTRRGVHPLFLIFTNKS